MASRTADEIITPLSFLEFTREHYKQDKNRPAIESADAMLSRDIRNYERYLDGRRAFNELGSFLWRCERIRETEYEFVPQANFSESPAPPCFSLFKSQTAGIGPAYESPQVYDTYGKFLVGLVSEETERAYCASRELVAEADRRWLYGLNRHDQSEKAAETHSLREEFRAAWSDASDIIDPEVIEHVKACCIPRIIQLTILIATENCIPEEERELIENDLLYAENWIFQAREQAANSQRPSPPHELEHSLTEQESVELDAPLSRYEWLELAEQSDNEYVENMTVEEFLGQLRDVKAQYEADTELSDDVDENTHIPRFPLQRDDVCYGAACTDGSPNSLPSDLL